MNKKFIAAIIIIIQICFIWRCMAVPAMENNSDEKTDFETEEMVENVQESSEEESLSGPETVVENEESEEQFLTSLDFIHDFQSLIIEGQQNVEDTPWNTNAGLIELEDAGKALLLTPNTGVMTPFMNITGKKITLKFCIYEGVRDMSDGAGLLLQIHGEEGKLLKEENIFVDSSLDWQTYECDLSGIGGDGADVRIVCNNGGNDDDVCDWVVINYAVIE